MMVRVATVIARFIALGCAALPVGAEIISDVANTKHNLSVSGPGDVVATSESQICVFCHTPHGATAEAAPLWNRELSNQVYTVYTSSSLDAEQIQGQLRQPGGSSKLCLSCHDGTLALGTVNVIGGQTNVTINLTGTEVGRMPSGQGIETGFTRNLGGPLGNDLTNDHPISFTYDSTLATTDGELFDPVAQSHIAVRAPGIRPPVPLENLGGTETAQMQCASCHDPHIRDTDLGLNIKFLRLNRFQKVGPAGGQFDQAGDIVCLGCHDKDGWATSVHADPSLATETYTTADGALREFPDGLQVWEAACLNCHDTHTVTGSRRLLREGTDAPDIVGGETNAQNPNVVPKSGGNSAIEETCYQCHSAIPVINNTAGDAKDIESDFLLPRRMPITTADQAATTEVHDILDRDFTETQVNLGKGGNLDNRHAECTDCHNPHRVVKNELFNATGTPNPTHAHGTGHTNIASGALRGTWGVEPVYGNSAFLSLPTTYVVKQGDGGAGASTSVNSSWVTREYQVCLKCHSDFAYDDDNIYPVGSRPNLGDSAGGTPSGTNGLTQYTNQAMEFQAPIGDQGEPGGNHRSWHPVIDNTGRSAADRNMSASTNMFLAPWNGANIGTQTMYCSDCHGTETIPGTAVPSGTNPWGPHGSTNDFILKGPWDSNSGTDNSGICFRCHNHTNYATAENEGDRGGFESGWGGPDRDTNLHAFHAGAVGNLQCTWCHVAVPHGWKNKAFLVNLNDVGPEAGQAPGTEVPITNNGQTYTQAPYYLNAKLKIINFATSGNWQDSNCGSASGQGGQGRDWMRTVCETPP
jgi:hypothetical protein